MKKLLIIFITVTTTYFFVGRSALNTHPLLNAKIEYLQNEGYTKTAAVHIAKVELKLIPEDDEYTSLMED